MIVGEIDLLAGIPELQDKIRVALKSNWLDESFRVSFTKQMRRLMREESIASDYQELLNKINRMIETYKKQWGNG